MAKIVSSKRGLHSSEYYERRKKESRFRWGMYFFFALIIIAIPVFLLRLERFRVDEVIVSGESVVSPEKVDELTHQVLAGMYFWVIPKNNVLLIPRRQIKSLVLQEMPRVKSLDLNLIDTKTISIQIQERIPYALYCSDLDYVSHSEGCYLLDKKGFIFAKSPSLSGDIYFVYVGGNTDSNPIGGQFLPPDSFEEITSFLDEVKSLGLSFKSLELIPSSSDNQAQFKLYNSEGVPVYWYAYESLETIYISLATIISSGILIPQLKPLDNVMYLDLTIPNKPYWKNK